MLVVAEGCFYPCLLFPLKDNIQTCQKKSPPPDSVVPNLPIPSKLGSQVRGRVGVEYNIYYQSPESNPSPCLLPIVFAMGPKPHHQGYSRSSTSRRVGRSSELRALSCILNLENSHNQRGYLSRHHVFISFIPITFLSLVTRYAVPEVSCYENSEATETNSEEDYQEELEQQVELEASVSGGYGGVEVTSTL